MKDEKQLTECPKCGDDSGFYRLGTYSGKYQCNYNFDGSNADNTELHAGVRYNERKSCYCLNCNHKLSINFVSL